MAIRAASLETVLTANTRQHDAAIATSDAKVRGLGPSAEKAKGQVIGAFAGMNSGASNLATTFGSLIPGIGGVTLALGAVVGVLGAATKAAMDEAVGIARLDTALQNNIAGWNGNRDAVESVISGRERLAFADDALRDSLGNLVTRTHDVNKAFELQSLAMDFARGKNIDLATATNIVGKVYDGNIGILSRYGVAVREGATATEALGQLQATFAGQAEAYGNSAQGAMDRLKNAFDNALETIGSAFLPIIATVASTMADLLPKIMSVVTAITDFLKPAFEAIGFVLNVIGTGIDWLGQQLGFWEAKTKETASGVQSTMGDLTSTFQTSAVDISQAGYDAADGYGSNLVGTIDSYQGDIYGAATDVYNNLDIVGDANSLGSTIGGAYVGGPGGVLGVINDSLAPINSAGSNVIAALDHSGAAASVGAAVGANFANNVISKVNAVITFLNGTGLFGGGGAGTLAPYVGSRADIASQYQGLAGMAGAGITEGTARLMGLPWGQVPYIPPEVGQATGAMAQAAADARNTWFDPSRNPLANPNNPDEGMYNVPQDLPPGSYVLPPDAVGGRQYQAADGTFWPTQAQADQHSAIWQSAGRTGSMSGGGGRGGSGRGGSGKGGKGGSGSSGGSGASRSLTPEEIAREAAENMEAITSAISSSMEALDALADFEKPSDDAINSFLDATQYVTNKLGDISGKWSEQNLAHVALFAESTGTQMEMVSKAADALGGLVDFKKPSDDAMNSFVDATDYLTDKFRGVAAKWDQDSLDSAAMYGEGTGKLLDGVGKATDLLGKLVDFKKPSDVAMQSFVDAVDYISDLFRRVVVKWDKESVESAAIYGEGMGKMLSEVGKATDSLQHIGDFKKPSDEAMRSFADALDYQTDMLRSAVSKWDKDSLSIAAFYGESMGKLMVGLGQAVDPLLHMGDFKAISEQAIDDFYTSLDQVIIGFGKGAATFKEHIGPTGAEVAAAVGAVTSGLSAAIDPLMKLADFKRPGKEQIDAYFGGLVDFITEFGRKAADFQGQASPIMADLAKNIGEIAGGLSSAFDPITKAADVQAVTKEQIEGAMSNVWELLHQADIVMKGMPADFAPKAKEFGSSVGTIFGAIQSGFDVASSIGGETGGSIGEGFNTALGSAGLLVAYMVGDATTAVLDFTTDTTTMRNTWVTGMNDMALASEDFARRANIAFDSIKMPQLDGGTSTKGGDTNIYDPVYIQGDVVPDTTQEEHDLLKGLAQRQRRSQRGMAGVG